LSIALIMSLVFGGSEGIPATAGAWAQAAPKQEIVTAKAKPKS